MDISLSTEKYVSWLVAELGSEILKKDLKKKRKEMAAGPFPFLRATYWRWAEMMPSLCQKLDLGTAPHALAVGDIHLENFGTWRDEDGRLVWGVNDYDEAAEMPYLLDLVRLATAQRSPEEATIVTSQRLQSPSSTATPKVWKSHVPASSTANRMRVVGSVPGFGSKLLCRSPNVRSSGTSWSESDRNMRRIQTRPRRRRATRRSC